MVPINAMALRVQGPEHSLGLSPKSPESAGGLGGTRLADACGLRFPRPAPLLPEGRSAWDAGGSRNAAALPPQSFGSLSSPLGGAPGVSSAARGQGPETEQYGRVSAVGEGAAATPGMQGEWGRLCSARASLTGAAPGPLREAAKMLLGASRGQPRGCAAAWRPRHAAGSLPAPRLCGVGAALKPRDQRPQSAGAGRRSPRAHGEMWSSYSPRAASASEREGLGPERTKCPRRGSKKQKATHSGNICVFKQQIGEGSQRLRALTQAGTWRAVLEAEAPWSRDPDSANWGFQSRPWPLSGCRIWDNSLYRSSLRLLTSVKRAWGLQVG